MQTGMMAFTDVYLKAKYGYVGFIEELPGVNSHGATLEEAREKLREVVEAVFAAERENCRELLAGKDTVREDLVIAFAPQKQPVTESRPNEDVSPTTRANARRSMAACQLNPIPPRSTA